MLQIQAQIEGALRGIEWFKSFGALQLGSLGSWDLGILGPVGSLISESNYKSSSKVKEWLWRGSGGGEWA